MASCNARRAVSRRALPLANSRVALLASFVALSAASFDRLLVSASSQADFRSMAADSMFRGPRHLLSFGLERSACARVCNGLERRRRCRRPRQGRFSASFGRVNDELQFRTFSSSRSHDSFGVLLHCSLGQQARRLVKASDSQSVLAQQGLELSPLICPSTRSPGRRLRRRRYYPLGLGEMWALREARDALPLQQRHELALGLEHLFDPTDRDFGPRVDDEVDMHDAIGAEERARCFPSEDPHLVPLVPGGPPGSVGLDLKRFHADHLADLPRLAVVAALNSFVDSEAWPLGLRRELRRELWRGLRRLCHGRPSCRTCPS